jgi:hypothetical protein
MRLTCNADSAHDPARPVECSAATVSDLMPATVYEGSQGFVFDLFHLRPDTNQYEKVVTLNNLKVSTRTPQPYFDGFPVINATSAQFKIRIRDYPDPSTIQTLVQPGNRQQSFACSAIAGTSEGTCSIDIGSLQPNTQYSFRFGVIYKGKEVEYIAPVVYTTQQLSTGDPSAPTQSSPVINITNLNIAQTTAGLSVQLQNVTTPGVVILMLSNGASASGICGARDGSNYCTVNFQGLEAGTAYTVSSYIFRPTGAGQAINGTVPGNLTFTTQPARVTALQSGYVGSELQITALISGYQPQQSQMVYFEDTASTVVPRPRIPAIAQCSTQNGQASCLFRIQVDYLVTTANASRFVRTLTLKIVNRNGVQISVPYSFDIPRYGEQTQRG